MPVDRITADSSDSFTAMGADLLEHHIERAVQQHGRCVIGLSGGSTPVPIYKKLGMIEHIDWSDVFIFLIDDRYVPADHADSNQQMVRTVLLEHIGIPLGNIVFPSTTLPLEECVADYGRRLDRLFAAPTPGPSPVRGRGGKFDISVLGMGPDGHIASLFPPLTDSMLSDQTVITTQTPLKPDGTPLFAVRDRITVTLPVLQRAKWNLFLLGKGKAEIWDQMEKSEEGVERWPAKGLIGQDVTLLMQG